MTRAEKGIPLPVRSPDMRINPIRIKKMKRPIFHMLCLCTALLTLSCTRDETSAVPQGGGPCPVTFRLETEAADGIAPVNEASTRIERPVTDLNFLVYGDGGLVRSGYLASPMIPTMKFAPGTYRVYAVANFGRQLGQISEEELLRLSAPVTAPDGFVQGDAMYLSGMLTLNVTGPTTGRMVLRRMAARVDLTVRIADGFQDAYLVHVLPGNAPADCPAFADHRLSASAPQLEFPYVDLTPGALRTFTMSYYQYENLAGTNPSVAHQRERTDANAPDGASYVTIRVLWDGAYWDYKVYLGSNSTTDFNVRRNTAYNYDITIEGVNADDLRISTTEYIFWAGRKLSIGGRYYRDGFAWSTRVAYCQLEIVTDNCAPGEEYAVSFRPLSGTFKSDWTMEYMISSLPSSQREYKPLVPGEQVAVHKGNGTSEVVFAFSNLEGTKNYNTEDNYFEFTVCDSRGRGRTAVLSTNMAEWLK